MKNKQIFYYGNNGEYYGKPLKLIEKLERENKRNDRKSLRTALLCFLGAIACVVFMVI